jgi:aryl-alcohol dehydrogenase-like predicted oxidoreductase
VQALDFRTLGRTDLKVSRIALGTMTFGGQTPETDAIQMVDRCLEIGINFFDTANVYNLGNSESILGKALSGRRHNVVLATKVGNRMGENPEEQGLTRPAIRLAIDASLRRLGTDYVDLYYLHQPDWNTSLEETLHAMDELVQEGKVRHPALSNYAAWQVVQMLWHCENHGYIPPTVSQPMYNLLARGIEQEYLACCREYRIGLVAYNPLAGGLLSGKHSRNAPPAAGTRFDGNRMYQDRYWHADYFEAQEEVMQIAARAGLSPVALAFRWLLSQPEVDCVLLGASRMEQLEENLAACDEPQLGEDVLRECDAVWKKLRGTTPHYNR